jgi:hypothetical protein
MKIRSNFIPIYAEIQVIAKGSHTFSCHYMLQTLASRALTLLYNGLPTYSNND